MAVIRNAIRAMEGSMPRERIERARSEAAGEILKIRLADLRKRMGIRQTELRSFSQSAISRLETRSDMKLSTLAAYVNDMGLSLEIKVRLRERSSTKRKTMTLLKT
jgi:hypothetical protein